MQEPPKIDLLECLVKRPGMYWGNSDNHFQSLVAFHSGAQMAMFPAYKNELENLIPPYFTDFVFEALGVPKNAPMAWMSVIEGQTKDGNEALNLFFELRKKNDQSKWAEKARETQKAKDS